MVCHGQSRLGWGNSRHLTTPPLFPQQNDVWETNAEILMTRHSPDLGSASDWLCGVGNLIQPIRGTTQNWGLTRHQYGIFVLVSQTSFGGKTSGSVAKCRLFSQAKCRPIVLFLQIISGSCVNETTLFSFLQSLLREKKADRFAFQRCSLKKQTWWSNDKTIIENSVTPKYCDFSSANNWSARHWQVTVFCSNSSNKC